MDPWPASQYEKRRMRGRRLLTAALVFGLSVGSDVAAAAEQAAVIATAKDDGRTVSLRRGQELELKLQANPSTGYGWAVAHAPEPVLTQEGQPSYRTKVTPGSNVGASGIETWRFRAAQTGRRTLRMEYRRPWEREVPPGAALTLRIVVE